MRLSERIYLVGSGSNGFDLTDPFDCHVYLLDGGDELALIDTGAGMGAEAIIANVKQDGFDPERIRHLVLTHGHGDHAGGAARLRRLLDEPEVHAAGTIADSLRAGDEKALSLDVAKKAGIYPPDYRFEPVPVDQKMGTSERVAAATVISLGRRRSTEPSRVASRMSSRVSSPRASLLSSASWR